MLPRTRRPRLLSLGAVAAAVLSSGCAAVSSHDVAVGDLGAPLTLTTTICSSNGDSNNYPTACTPGAGLPSENKQLVVGWQVPAGSTLRSVDVAGGPAGATLTRRPAAEAQYASQFGTAPGHVWIAAATGRLTATTSPVTSITAKFDTPGANGVIAQPTWKSKTYFYSRAVTTDAEAESTGTCPAGCSYVRLVNGAQTDKDLTLRDLVVQAGAPATVKAGQTAVVPFTMRTVGDVNAASLNPTATTDIAGAQASLDRPTTDGDVVTQPVRVVVPASAAGGERRVTFTVPLAQGGRRQVSSTLNVVAAPKTEPKPQPGDGATKPPAPPAPVAGTPPAPTSSSARSVTPAQTQAAAVTLVKLTAKAPRRAALLRSGLAVRQVVPAGTVVWELRLGGIRLARLARTVKTAGAQTATLRLTKAGKKALGRRNAAKKLTVVATFTDAAGKRTVTKATVRLR